MVSRPLLASLLVLLRVTVSRTESRATSLGWCNDFRNYIDPLALTEQGRKMIDGFQGRPLQMIMWSPSQKEASYSCIKVTFDDTFAYEFKDGSSSVKKTGSYSVVRTSDSIYINLEFSDQRDSRDLLGADYRGWSDLYPLYISDTEMILIGCNTFWFTKNQLVYVLSNQEGLEVDAACAAPIINSYTNFATVQPKGCT